jgi:TonB family protein
LLDKILPELKNWTPVEKNGNNITAKGLFAFFPDDLFENYKDGYAPEKLNADAGFKPNGLSSFRDEVAKRVDLGGFNGRGKITVIINFVVDIDGSVTDVAVEKSSGVKEFDDRFIDAIKKVKKKWVPAKLYGNPIRQRYKIPFSINFD